MSDDEKWERIVAEMTKKTLAGELVWKPSATDKRENALSEIYETKVLGRDVVVYEYRYQYYTDEDEWHWLREVAIEFTEPLSDHTWRWPRTAARYDLLEAIKRQAFRADQFANEFASAFLKDEPPPVGRRRVSKKPSEE